MHPNEERVIVYIDGFNLYFRLKPALVATLAVGLAACASIKQASPTDVAIAPTPSTAPGTPVHVITATSAAGPSSLPSLAAERSPTATASPTPTPSVGPNANLLRDTVIEGAQALAWSSNGERIAVTTSDGVILLDAVTLAQIASQSTTHRQLALASSSDGKLLVTADHWLDGQRLRLWEAQDLTLRWEKDIPGVESADASAEGMVFLPSGEIAVMSSEAVGLGIWLVAPDGRMNRALRIDGVIAQAAALNPSKGWVAAAVGPPEHGVRIYNLGTGALLEELPVRALLLEFARQAPVLLARRGSSVDVWDVEQSRDIAQVPITPAIPTLEGLPFRISLSHGDMMFATGTEIPSPGIGIWELETGELLGLIEHDDLDKITWLAFSPVKDELAILMNDGELEIWGITR